VKARIEELMALKEEEERKRQEEETKKAWEKYEKDRSRAELRQIMDMADEHRRLQDENRLKLESISEVSELESQPAVNSKPLTLKEANNIAMKPK